MEMRWRRALSVPLSGEKASRKRHPQETKTFFAIKIKELEKLYKFILSFILRYY
jgi:hypothetical protein